MSQTGEERSWIHCWGCDANDEVLPSGLMCNGACNSNISPWFEFRRNLIRSGFSARMIGTWHTALTVCFRNRFDGNGVRDVFCALLDHFVKHKVGSSVFISDFVFHYILSPGEPSRLGRANVWSAIVRPSTRPTVTAITGIRNSFCFRVAGDNVLAVRELSCRYASFLEYRWTECSNTEVGDWRHVTLTNWH